LTLDPRIQPLGLDEEEVQALVAFLESLTSPDVRRGPWHSFPPAFGPLILYFRVDTPPILLPEEESAVIGPGSSFVSTIPP